MTKPRHLVQLGFLIVVLAGTFGARANCERWCPFGGVEAIYTYATEGNMLCSLGTSNFFILGGVLLATVLLRRAFCSYMCPIGTLSEWIHSVGRRLHLPRFIVPAPVDRILGLLKYAILAVILVATWHAGELVFRGFDPCYALISRHGADITIWAYVVAGTIVLLSLVLMLPFCRWLCPFAAVLNPFSRFAFARIRRQAVHCSGCGVCAKSCPMAIPLNEMSEVTAARCTSCLSCVDACPRNRNTSVALSWGPPRLFYLRWSQSVLIVVLLTCTTAAVMASYLFPMPSFIKSRGTPPERISQIELNVEHLTCRGRGNLFFYFLERDDLFEIPGYIRVEAWPDPTLAHVRIAFDPSKTNENVIKQAITEPYFDVAAAYWRSSPFRVEGYDPLASSLGLPGLPLDIPK